MKQVMVLIAIFFLGCTTKQPSLENKVVELRQLLSNKNDLNIGSGINVGIEDDNKTINISFENNILFDFNKYDVKSEFQYILEKISTFLIQNSKFGISIEGHTDSVGNKEYNQKLSEKRALSVASVLIENNVPSERISSIGYGEEFPKYDNDTKEGRERNRRAEIRLRENIKDFIFHNSSDSIKENKDYNLAKTKQEDKIESVPKGCKVAKATSTGFTILTMFANALVASSRGDSMIDGAMKGKELAEKERWINGIKYICD